MAGTSAAHADYNEPSRHKLLAISVVAALVYPMLLVGVYRSGRLLSATEGRADIAVGTAALAMALSLVLAVPILALIAASRLGAVTSPTGSVNRMLSLAAFAVPPLFTFIGVLAYMAGFPNGDYWMWALIWVPAVTYAWRKQVQLPSVVRRPQAPGRLRLAHGVVAATLIAGFLIPHFANHLIGFWSAEAHIAVMEWLRTWYRHPFVEPVIVGLMLFMVTSGLLLVRVRTALDADPFTTLQIATGAYLLIFIPGHLNSVFLFQRDFMGAETDFWFASGGAAGLLGDPWSVRLIPHYLFGVWSLITHGGCGLRKLLMEHGVGIRIANRITVWVSFVGAVAAVIMVSALCRVHLTQERTAFAVTPVVVSLSNFLTTVEGGGFFAPVTVARAAPSAAH